MKRRKLGATNRDLGLHGASTPKLGYSQKYSDSFDDIFRRPERALKSPPVVIVDEEPAPKASEPFVGRPDGRRR